MDIDFSVMFSEVLEIIIIPNARPIAILGILFALACIAIREIVRSIVRK